MEGIIGLALFLGGVVVICAPVFDSGKGCGTLALMFFISILILVGFSSLSTLYYFPKWSRDELD